MKLKKFFHEKIKALECGAYPGEIKFKLKKILKNLKLNPRKFSKLKSRKIERKSQIT
jgi:hypothetical protein